MISSKKNYEEIKDELNRKRRNHRLKNLESVRRKARDYSMWGSVIDELSELVRDK